MTANANIVNLAKGTSNLVRPRFSPGLLLRDDDLTTGVDYTRDLSRLLFRSLFGCGVVCGLEVTAEEKCGKLLVTVASGVALNGMGDPVHVPRLTEVLVDPTCGKPIPPKIWVVLCRTEKCCAPRTTVCGCDEEDSASVCTREQDGFEIRLVQAVQERCACLCKEKSLPPPPAPRSTDGSQPTNREEKHDCWCADPCDPCYRAHYDGDCGCECCDPNCVVLAVLINAAADKEYAKSDAAQKAAKSGNPWIANHSVRRFVRPVLMRDPTVFREQYPGVTLCDEKPSGYGRSQLMVEDTSTPSAAPARNRAAMKVKAGAAPAAANSTGAATARTAGGKPRSKQR
jgi:hypothetical protein